MKKYPRFSLVRPNGDMLAHWMYHKAMDPARLADLAGVGRRTIYRMLNEEGAIRLSTLAKVAKALDIPPTMLIRSEGGDSDAA